MKVFGLRIEKRILIITTMFFTVACICFLSIMLMPIAKHSPSTKFDFLLPTITGIAIIATFFFVYGGFFNFVLEIKKERHQQIIELRRSRAHIQPSYIDFSTIQTHTDCFTMKTIYNGNPELTKFFYADLIEKGILKLDKDKMTELFIKS